MPEQRVRVYVPANDRTYEPTEDPAWWRDVELCDQDCHHPVHAFRPERRHHLEQAIVIDKAMTSSRR